MSAVNAEQIFSRKYRQAVLEEHYQLPARLTLRSTHAPSAFIFGICEYERRHKRCPNQD